jgi:hypothetical protein
MKLLPRPEALTGEVYCGHHKLPGNPSAWCERPANHEGPCKFVVGEYDWKETAPTQGNSRSSRREGQSMFDYLNSLGYEAFGPEWSNVEEKNFKYDGGGFKGPPRDSKPYYKMDIDFASGDSWSRYMLEDPDTGDMVIVTAEEFNQIYTACAVGPAAVQKNKYEKMVREFLKGRK